MSKSFYQENSDIILRYELATERIAQISSDGQLPAHLQKYFDVLADYVLTVCEVVDFSEEDFDKKKHDEVYAVFDTSKYNESYLCPTYAVSTLGNQLGGLLSSLFYQMTGLIQHAYAHRVDLVTIYLELFLEIYGLCCMEDDELVCKESIAQAFYYFKHDYCNTFLSERIISQIDSQYDYYLNIIMNADLSSDDYLYRTGLFVSDNERRIAAHLRTMSEDSLRDMAQTFVDGYIKGFEVTRKDISKKETVGLSVPLGFELMTRQAVMLFNEAGLSCTLRFGGLDDRDWFSTCPNKQCRYDHKDDVAYIWDKGLCDRMLEVIKNTFEKHSELAAVYGGPAVIETFGQAPFQPVEGQANARLSDKQNQLNVYYMSQNAQITNEYIKGEERSFTIIAYPIPEIGSEFSAIFNETVAINTMDYELYKQLQAKIIDKLDQGTSVHITGRGENQTDIVVALHKLDDTNTQTNFENCVADVNIPVGEVFTSPVLEGTNGVLHVTHVYIDGMGYKDLKLIFENGMVVDYSCANGSSLEDGRKLIFENILYRHETLPMGEFAIGTNTKAFMMGQHFQIADKLPILIAEKTGPHFAVGDTCYSHCEDIPMYNPDGKECIARDNECSIKRKNDFSSAYFNCHTDITIPYYELGDIIVECADGSKIPIIENGIFVVEGTQILNQEFEK